MKLPETVQSKLRDPEAIVLPRTAPVKKGRMIIHYHCDGKPIGETTFSYTPEAYADWFRSMAEAVGHAATPEREGASAGRAASTSAK